MRNLSSWIFVTLLTSLFFLAACASSRKAARPETTPTTVRDFDKMQEDLDPLSLDDYGIEFNEDEQAQTGSSDILSAGNPALRDTVGNGFRVQLIQTTDPEEAKDVQRDAILRFNEEVYRVFDPPYYKVRVGDFVNWRDAEKVQNLAIRKGFREAWIVRSKVNLKKAYKEMEQF